MLYDRCHFTNMELTPLLKQKMHGVHVRVDRINPPSFQGPEAARCAGHATDSHHTCYTSSHTFVCASRAPEAHAWFAAVCSSVCLGHAQSLVAYGSYCKANSFGVTAQLYVGASNFFETATTAMNKAAADGYRPVSDRFKCGLMTPICQPIYHDLSITISWYPTNLSRFVNHCIVISPASQSFWQSVEHYMFSYSIKLLIPK